MSKNYLIANDMNKSIYWRLIWRMKFLFKLIVYSLVTTSKICLIKLKYEKFKQFQLNLISW